MLPPAAVPDLGPFAPFPIGSGDVVRLVLTSGFGTRRDPVTGKEGAYHNGIDLGIPQGTPVYAAAPGRIVGVYQDDQLNGNALVIDHRPAGFPYWTSYVHLSALAAHAAIKGALVDRDRPIGWSGGTPGTPGAGKSTGPHLHFRVRSVGPTGTATDVDPTTAVNWLGFELVRR